MKQFSVKGDRKIQVALEGDYEKKCISAFEETNFQQVGYLHFKTKEYCKDAYLCTIKVDDPEYLRSGVGSIMMNCFENYCINNGIRSVEGRFYPNGDGGIFAREFYESHGYSIFRDGYEQYIHKTLDPEEIQNEDYVIPINDMELGQEQ